MWERAVRPVEEGVVMRIEVRPGSLRNEWSGYDKWRNVLRIRIDAQPQKGKANLALVRFIADSLGLQPANVRIISGAKSHLKEVLVQTRDVGSVRGKLSEVIH